MASTITYPLEWLESNFSSESKADTLLKPELENGTLSLHDYELAKSFYPGRHRYLPLLYANVVGVGTIVFGSRFARPRWSMARTVSLVTVSSSVGYLMGFQHKLFYHVRFAYSLEDSVGFNRALQNINLRLGGPTPWPYGVLTKEDPIIQASRGSPSSSPTLNNEQPYNGDTTWDTPNSTSPAPTQQHTTTPSTSSRWDQIRAANSKSGTLSSWDLLRQAHERSRVQNQTDSESQQPEASAFGNKDDVPRPPSDEARFSAMLEAEQRRSSRS